LAHACGGGRNGLISGLGACRLSGLVWDMAWRGRGSIVAPGTWRWPAGVVPVARRGLGLLPGASGAEVVAVGWWCCGLPAIGWGAAG
jgi:hypothetical protein